MQGATLSDEKGNPIRILEFISGKTLADMITVIQTDHEAYFYETMPSVLRNYIQCVKAIRFLHNYGEKHGDIHRDHVLIDNHSGCYRWIDFDYNYRHRENMFGYDLFGIGNIGKNDVLTNVLKQSAPTVLEKLKKEDLNIVFRNRVVNLKKIYPYIPEALNRVLLHFSRSANWYYEHTSQLISDLESAALEI